MAAIEAFRRGDEVCTKASGGPIMTVLAAEGLKVRCADGENLQYWFDTVMLERYKQSQRHSEVSETGNGQITADGERRNKIERISVMQFLKQREPRGPHLGRH